MGNLKFTEEHDWVRLEEGDIGVVGITDYAQDQLGDLVYVELPEVDRQVERGEEVVTLESVKAASDVKSPVSGTIVAVNEALDENPGIVNEDSAGEGWIFKIRLSNPEELASLMDEAAYKRFLEG